uniref:Os01g0778700 protein n=1 Tax=Macrostomum lignano TaxID=282301 RepID=A0A1I8FLW4_9PLAT
AAAGSGSAVSRMTQLLETRAGGASAIIELDEADKAANRPTPADRPTPAKPRPAPRTQQQSEGAKQQQASKHTSLHHTCGGGSSMDSGFPAAIPATSSATLPPGLPGWRVEEGGLLRRLKVGRGHRRVGEVGGAGCLSADAGVAAATAAQAAEISLPVGGRLQETRKESPVKALRLPTAGLVQAGRPTTFGLTGPDLLFYRSRSRQAAGNWPWPCAAVGAWTRLAARQRLPPLPRTILRRDR